MRTIDMLRKKLIGKYRILNNTDIIKVIDVIYIPRNYEQYFIKYYWIHVFSSEKLGYDRIDFGIGQVGLSVFNNMKVTTKMAWDFRIDSAQIELNRLKNERRTYVQEDRVFI